MPNITGYDIGIKRRIHTIPFDITIKPNEQDKDLIDKLSLELPGILRWAVEGCMEWQRVGLKHPDGERVYEDAYKDDIDLFLQLRCEYSDSFQISKDELYREYEEWAGLDAQTKKQFGARMKQKGFKEKKSGIRYWVGVKLISESKNPLDLGTFEDFGQKRDTLWAH
jgi:putative DNA primase/helicase